MLIRTITYMIRPKSTPRLIPSIHFPYSQSFKINPSKDYYSLLELHKDANNPQIESSFQKLSLLYHPDINPANLNKYNELLQARTVLTNQKLRKQYDKERFLFKFDKEMNNRFENPSEEPYETKKTDRYSYELTPEEEEVAWKTKRFFKRVLIVSVGLAIFLPFILWKGGDPNNPQTIQHDPTMRLSSIHRQQLRNQYDQRQQGNQPNPQQQYGQYPMQRYPNQNPNIIVTGQIVQD